MDQTKIEVQAKVGKKKREIIVVSIDEEDFKSLDEQSLYGEFNRGQVYICHKKNEEKFMEKLKEAQKKRMKNGVSGYKEDPFQDLVLMLKIKNI